MLNAAYGVLAMVPVLFWIAGYAMVSRWPQTGPVW